MAGVLINSAQVIGNIARERMVERIQDHVDAGTMLPGCTRGESSVHPCSAYAKAIRTEVRARNLDVEQVEIALGSNNSEAILSDFGEGERIPAYRQIEPIIRAAGLGALLSEIGTCPLDNKQVMTEMIDRLSAGLDDRSIFRNRNLSRSFGLGWLSQEGL